MNEALDPVSGDELHAFVDGQLDDARLQIVLEWLKANPAEAARVLEWQAQRQQLRRMARALPLDDTPSALSDVVLRASGRATRRTRWQQAAAALLLVVLGAAGGYFWPQSERGEAPSLMAASPAFVRDAAIAHAVYVPEQRHPVEVTVADEAHLVQWLSRRLGSPLKVPSLIQRGYHLLGGRLLPGEGIPRAQFMYENARGTRVTLYVAVFAPGQAPSPTSFRSVREGNEESFYWIEDRFGYALSGEVNATDMMALARDVYGQLER